MAHQPQRLVVQVAVHVALARRRTRAIRSRPHTGQWCCTISASACRDEGVERLVEVARPRQRVARLRAAQRAKVVHRVARGLGQVQHAQAG